MFSLTFFEERRTRSAVSRLPVRDRCFARVCGRSCRHARLRAPSPGAGAPTCATAEPLRISGAWWLAGPSHAVREVMDASPRRHSLSGPRASSVGGCCCRAVPQCAGGGSGGCRPVVRKGTRHKVQKKMAQQSELRETRKKANRFSCGCTGGRLTTFQTVL